jgi:hypothetical protein
LSRTGGAGGESLNRQEENKFQEVQGIRGQEEAPCRPEDLQEEIRIVPRYISEKTN